jgi:CHC2-type zinc finger protein
MRAFPDLTLDRLAEAKALPVAFLVEQFRAATVSYLGATAVALPYLDRNGKLVAQKIRLSDGSCRWQLKDRLRDPYGVHLLGGVPGGTVVLAVEGESDTWAGWFHRQPTLGVPSATSWQSSFAKAFTGYAVSVWEEPDAGGAQFLQSLVWDLPHATVLPVLDGVKDLCDLHQQAGDRFEAEVARRIARAVPIRRRVLALLAREQAKHIRLPARGYVQLSHDGHDLDRARHADLRLVCADLGMTFRGRKARCPFPEHEDSTPSFSVFQGRDGTWRFRCFGCGRHGDAIDLLRQLHGMDFRTAVQEVVR